MIGVVGYPSDIQVICNLQPLSWWFPGAKFFVAQRTDGLLATLASLKISSYVALIAGGSGIDGISKTPSVLSVTGYYDTRLV